VKARELIKILNELSESRQIEKDNARIKITAINQLLKMFPEYAESNVYMIVVSDLLEKHNRNSSINELVNISTLKTYISRFKSAMKIVKPIINGEKIELSIINKNKVSPITIEISKGIVIKVLNIPKDFKLQDHKRISKVLEAYIKGVNNEHI
jgi:hypothetical protein